MKTRNKFIMFFVAAIMVLLASPSPAYTGDEEYILNLDITVAENDSNEVVIIAIGRYSPFRRYSWFRRGDVIEAVDGVKASIFYLHALHNNQGSWIQYRRGASEPELKQISLEKTFFDLPGWLGYK